MSKSLSPARLHALCNRVVRLLDEGKTLTGDMDKATNRMKYLLDGEVIPHNVVSKLFIDEFLDWSPGTRPLAYVLTPHGKDLAKSLKKT